ncbi:MAG: phenylacetate--CoA ligase family protein [Chloroflexota bacterium]
MIWDRENECRARDDLRRLQIGRLQATLARVYEQMPFYRRRLDACGLKPGDVRSVEDLARLPFLTKDDLREHFPYGLFAVPMREVVRVHASSGTTGRPTVVGYTRRDLETWAEVMGRVVTAAGVTADDIAQISFGYGFFTGAFGLHYALERVGATVLPVSGGNTERQVEIMRNFGSTALVCTPSYALRIAEVAGQMGVNFADLRLRVGLFGAEPWSESMRRELEARLSIIATDNYGLSEVIGPGIAGECLERDGMHINEDHFLVEVVDPETGKHVAPGEMGELVFTSLTKEAFPVIRYRTRDISRVTTEPCACGRTSARMTRVFGRTDDMLIIRGVNVFPSQIEEVLLEIEGTEPHYQIVVDRQGTLDDIEVRLEVSEKTFADGTRKMFGLRERIEHRLGVVLNIGVRVKLVEPGSIERSQGKAKRVIDKRSL